MVGLTVNGRMPWAALVSETRRLFAGAGRFCPARANRERSSIVPVLMLETSRKQKGSSPKFNFEQKETKRTKKNEECLEN
jgi:hypothetical protein